MVCFCTLHSTLSTLHFTLHALHWTKPNSIPPDKTHAATARLSHPTLYTTKHIPTWHTLYTLTILHLDTPHCTLSTRPTATPSFSWSCLGGPPRRTKVHLLLRSKRLTPYEPHLPTISICYKISFHTHSCCWLYPLANSTWLSTIRRI
jgi:hypothetical protein